MNAQREEEENEKKVATKDDLERERIDEKGATSASAGISSIKEKENQFFPVYKFLEKNLVFKYAFFGSSEPKNEQKTKNLSRRIVRLLRWTLPNSGVAYSKQDGTVNARDLSFYLKVPLEEIMEAIAPTGDDKIRLIAIQMLSLPTKIRIGCLGGHGLQVYAPPGHCLIPFSKYLISIEPLVHETDAADSILASECVSAMEQIGGINFCPRKAGG